MSRTDLTGRVAVVTGCSGNLGPLWCEVLHEAGAIVVGLDLKGVSVAPRFQRLLDIGRAHLVPADIRSRHDLEAALRVCNDVAGVPQILVNNAGLDQPPTQLERSYSFEDLPAELSEQILAVNVLGTLQATQVFGGEMARAGHGSIVTIGSLYSSVSPDSRFYAHLEPPFLKPPAYGASKAALVSLTRHVATLWGPRGVRANVLSPGGVQGAQDATFIERFTERVPLGRLARDADLIGPLLFLASDASSYVTGTELIVDGGFTAW